MARRRHRPRRTWPQRLLIGFNSLLIVTCLVVAGAMGYVNYKLDNVERIDLTGVLTPTDSGGEGDEVSSGPQNYLLVGTDSAERLDPSDPVNNGRENLGTLSDTIMLLRVDPDSTQAQLLSFPRDLWVTIPGYGESKINAALSAGGADTLVQTIQDNFGIPVNHYVEVDFEAFEQLVAAVDGVPMYFDKVLYDPTTGLDIPHTGCVTLDPRMALAYARSRHLEFSDDGGQTFQVDGSGDLGRITRQQEFIRHAMQRAIAKGVRNPIVLNSLIDAGIANITLDTGLTADDLVDLGRRFRNFDPNDLQTMSLDVYDDFVNGQSILRLQDTEANQQRIDIFKGVGGPGSDQAAGVRIAVQNGTGASGQATEVADGYEALGFDTSPGTGDAESFDFGQTTVRYTAGNEAKAQWVADQLESGAQLEEVGSLYGLADVILVTGIDYAGVKTELSPPPDELTGGTGAPTDTTLTSVPPTSTHYGEVPPPAPEGQDCG